MKNEDRLSGVPLLLGWAVILVVNAALWLGIALIVRAAWKMWA